MDFDNHILPNPEALAAAAAAHLVERARAAIADRGRFSVAVTGGSTPRATYSLLASEEFADRIDWPRVHVFWGDERCVPPEHADSNYRMTRETLLDHVPIPAGQVHRIRGEIDPAQAAEEYEGQLREHFADGPPRFDLILLGMGEDGHCASLFPGTAAVREKQRWVVAHVVEKLSAWRVTMTPVILNAAARVAFVVSGENKAARLREVQQGDPDPDRFPAQTIRPASGEMVWFLDLPAASCL